MMQREDASRDARDILHHVEKDDATEHMRSEVAPRPRAQVLMFLLPECWRVDKYAQRGVMKGAPFYRD